MIGMNREADISAIVVNFQIAQVGNDKGAQDFLAQLDKDKSIGGLIDCTSSRYPTASPGITAANRHA